jgi:hypothetical protein
VAEQVQLVSLGRLEPAKRWDATQAYLAWRVAMVWKGLGGQPYRVTGGAERGRGFRCSGRADALWRMPRRNRAERRLPSHVENALARPECIRIEQIAIAVNFDELQSS